MSEYRYVTRWSGRSSVKDDHVSCDPPSLQVLCVSNDAVSLALLERSLRQMARYEPRVTTAGTIMTACFALASDTFDMAIIDGDAMGAAGMELIAEFAQTKVAQTMCDFVLLTGCVSPEIEQAALMAGVARCLAKDELTAKRLEAVIHGALTGQRVEPFSVGDLVLTAHQPSRPESQGALADLSALTGRKPDSFRPVLVVS